MSEKPNITRTEKVTFMFEGKFVTGFLGETIGSALLRNSIVHLRDAPHSKTPRGMFCAMGLCQECVVDVKGYKKEACNTPIYDGMVVTKVNDL